MKRLGAVVYALGAWTCTSILDVATAQAFECPTSGDACDVRPGEMRVEFANIGAGDDTVVLGTFDYLFYHHFVACVNGLVQFATDPNGWVRAHLDQDTVLCTEGGHDTVTVLGAGASYPCSFAGFPVTLGALNYNGKELKIHAGSGHDLVRGGDGFDRICAGSGNDRIYGNGERNELSGGDGNDYVEGGTDVDWLFGGAGDDTVIDNGAGGFRNYCSTWTLPPSRIEGGDGNDCLDLPASSEPGWCYGQEEPCDVAAGIPCHGGITCGNGSADRIANKNTPWGYSCETRIQLCTRQ